MLKTYYLVAKPGIIMGNLITTAAGFAFASRGSFDVALFLWMFLGLGAVIGSACVFNNYVDRKADSLMERTKNRPLVQGLISGRHALLFASFLAFFGFSLLTAFTNPLSVFSAAAGFFLYVGLYSFWKYHNTFATFVGSIAGAMPPVVGYAAAAKTLDLGALFLFVILVLWQMPHFFAIAIYRQHEYTAAGIPTLPSVHGMLATKKQTLYYVLAFSGTLGLLALQQNMGVFYYVCAFVCAASWIYFSVQGFKRDDDKVWARDMFRLSLIIITLLSLAISV